MTELKATPGPWEIDHMTSGTARYNIRAKNGPITVNPATAYHLSDAHLIAAAPDEDEALGECLTLLKALTGPDDELAQAIIQKAEKARAKARGETE